MDGRGDDMDTPGRLCGPLLTATGVIHLGYGVVAGRDGVRDILASGVDGAVEVSASGENRCWFLVAGLPMVLAGRLVTRLHARTGELPAFLGWCLLLLAALVYFMPASGFWVFLPQAALALYASRTGGRPRVVSEHAAR